MKKSVFIVVLSLLVLPLFLNAQKSINHKLNWEKPVQTKFNGEFVELLSFEGADYNQNGLPVFSNRTQIRQNGNKTKLELSNLVYAALSTEEMNIAHNLEGITGKLSLSSSLSTERKNKFLEYSLIPIRINPQTGAYEKLISFSVNYKIVKTKVLAKLTHSYTNHSVLSSGKWVKIAIKDDGIYKISFDDLSSMGITNPSNVHLFGNNYSMLSMANADESYDDLTEMAIRKGSDYILFYAKGPVTWNYDTTNEVFLQELHRYSDYAYYFLTSDVGIGKTINVENSIPNPNNYVTSFNAYSYHEQEDTNLIKSGREWYGEEFGVLDNIDYDFHFPNILTNEPVKIKTSVIARSTSPSSFYVYVDGNLVSSLENIDAIIIDPDSQYAKSKVALDEFIPTQDNITVELNYQKPNASAKAWLNYLCLNARRQLKMAGSQMQFRDVPSVGAGNITQFTLSGANSNIEIWDITEVTNAKKINATLSGSDLVFTVASDVLREFIAFDGSTLFSPENNELVENQDIHGEPIPDYVIVAPEIFFPYANQLADIHREMHNLNVLVVSTDEVYNEFSSGAPDVSAIRNMMRMFYDRATTEAEMPDYLLLFGDGSYDNKKIGDGNTNFILTYQSSNSLHPVSSFCTDDFFGFLDEDEGYDTGDLDIGIGRLPVSSETQAQQALDKIVHYLSPATFGDWRNMLCFIADDSDNANTNQHMQTAEGLCTFLHENYPVLNFDKIYLDAYPQEYTASGERYPDAEIAIDNRLNKGALLVNYTGHGNELGLTHEQVIQINNILNWTNYDHLPLFLTATCEFSRFDDYGRTSGGELVFLNNQGGGFALFTTTRPVYPSSLSHNFYEYAFQKVDKKYYCMGDLVRLTKNATGSTNNVNKKKFVLLGDPAFKLAYPKYNIVTTEVNDNPVGLTIDTLKAMSFVTIKGYVENLDGNLLDNFNGFIYPTVFDKSKVLQTLGNEGNEPMSYSSQNNILYKGKVSVINGNFSFSFVVPKDISYNYGYGKISYYAENGEDDAAGYSNQIIIGGSLDEVSIDSEGPSIKIYMNNQNFVDGGMTDENPKIVAFVSDSTGINTVGNGIGHDIVAILDNNTASTYNLNEYYQADLDSYQSGKIEYPLSGLDPGKHTLSLRVWDVYNNSSVDSIEFIVAESAEMTVSRLFNYPNPFTQSTDFYFEQNQVNTDLEVLIQIYTVSGRLVKTLETDMFADGYRVGPIHWDGLDDFGNNIGRGVYIYKLRIKTSEGKTIDKLEKLVLLK